MKRPSITDIRPVHWIVVFAILVLTSAALLWAGRSPICTCGYVELFHPALDSGNSQHLADWYTPSHIIHGFLFYALGWLILRSRPPGERLILAVTIEAAWMALGFAFARRSPIWLTIAIAIGFELLTLAIIRDNLTLNILMLVAPVDAIKVWQGGG